MYHSLKRAVGVSGLVFFIVATSGCHRTPIKPAQAEVSKVGYKLIIPNGASHYELKQGESSKAPVLVEKPSPLYPETLVKKSLPPIDVVAQLIVGVDGHVQSVRINKYLGDNTYRDPFNSAVRDAAMRWVFTPLEITQKVEHPGAPATFETVQKPFSLWYMFHFQIVDGHPVTSSESKG